MQAPEVHSPTLDRDDGPGSVSTDEHSEHASVENAPIAEKQSPTGGGSGMKPSKRYVDEDSKSPEYRSDAWRMANFKVVPCSKRYAHDWTICPFAHPGEKARRRDPKQYNYAGIACPEMKKAGFCARGDRCPYAHNVFEFWLHPTRYRTQLCNDGQNCTRNVCFFAHTLEEMRAVPGKLVEAKKEVRRGGMMSPDTPFIHSGSSLATTSSTGSAEVWGLVGQDERNLRRSSGILPDDSMARAHSTHATVDELASSLANVKLAMSSEKREEVIALLSKLLQEAKDEGVQGSQSFLSQSNREAELLLALRALDSSQAQVLLPDASNLARLQLANISANDPATHQALRELLQPGLNGSRPLSASNALLTAPAAMDPSNQQHHAPRPGRNLGNRVLSADMGMAPSNRGMWQPNAFGDALARGLPGIDRAHFGGADPGELRRRSFHLEEALAKAHNEPRREVRRPPISAFQKAATQEWKHPVGRNLAPHEMKWGNSGSRLSSSDLGTISEGLPSLRYNSTDMMFNPAEGVHRPPSAGLPPPTDRSRSLGGLSYEVPTFNLLSTPLSLPATQPGGRDTSALHTAPFDLALAYAAEHQLDQQRCQSYDQQSWGNMLPPPF